MNNKKDWEELEKWAEDEKKKKEKKYNIDIEKFYKEKEEKNEKRLVRFKKTKMIFILVISIFIMIVFTYYKIGFSEFKTFVNNGLNMIITLLKYYK